MRGPSSARAHPADSTTAMVWQSQQVTVLCVTLEIGGSAGMHSELAEGLARYTLVPETIFAYRFSEGRGWLLEAWECTKEEVIEETSLAGERKSGGEGKRGR